MNVDLARVRWAIGTALAAWLSGGTGVGCATRTDDGNPPATGAGAARRVSRPELRSPP